MTEANEFPEVPVQLEAVWGSSNVTATGYDEDTSILVVEYVNGAQYRWDGIPRSVYEALRAAASVGKYLRALEAQYGKGTRIG